MPADVSEQGYAFPTGIAAQKNPYERSIDPWSFVDYKAAFGQAANVAPTWVGEHRRRLTAYKIYDDFYRNAARFWLTDATEDEMKARREYGDAFVVVETYLNSLLGNDQSIIVPDAGKVNPEAAAKDYQTKLLAWADTEQLDMKVEENERNAMKLGDEVYVLWPRDGQPPLVEVWDPGFYFPVLDPSQPSSQFPRKVHMAYEFEQLISGRKVRFVRRHTWELVKLVVLDAEDGSVVVDPDGTPVPGEQALPWDRAATDTCTYEVSVFRVSDIETQEDDPDLKWGTPYKIEVERMDLQIDFIPVVHIPGLLPSLQEHYGISILGPTMQVFDDLQGNDTDTAAAGRTTGTPALAVSGTGLPTTADGKVETWGPGQVFNTGDGTATLIDTSRSLDALLKHNDSLLKRLSVNSRIPESMLGRIKPSEVPSGITLTISFGPHTGVINKMRRIRRRKYTLLLKFAGRLMWRAGLVSNIYPAEYHFGSFLPADRMEVLDLVTKGLTTDPPVISQYTAVRMLVEAGFPIDDANAEVARITQEDWDTANKILDAIGDPNFVRQRMGISVPAPTPPSPGPQPEA
jgi:hypothetical protein